MKARSIAFATVLLALAAVAWAAQGTLAIVINGKRVKGSSLTVKGQTYVPLAALKEAGATAKVEAGKLTISFAPAGGANQVTALEGKAGEWLFNGIWRVPRRIGHTNHRSAGMGAAR